jgi:hypothetical protein
MKESARLKELGRKIGQSQAFMFIAQFGFTKKQIA